MTNRSFHLNKDRTKQNRPFLLKPAAKDYIWGGRRLNDDFSKNIDIFPLAETWECSTHPDGLSIVADGIYKGQSLADVLKKHPEYLGTHPETYGELPIIIKFIDAKKDLSVQVHPTDEYAAKYENGQSGKTEMWYVLDALKDAQLVYGFKTNVNRNIVRKAIADGTVEKYLQKVPVKKNDVFYISAGTVHAIGAGILVAEIQENSNLTYRMYDYNRIGTNGTKRPLHVDKALEAADFSASTGPRQPLRVLKYRKGCASELLCRCRHFEVCRMIINTENCRELVSYQSDSSSFRVLLCTDGCGLVKFENEILEFFKGDCIFVPAGSVRLKIHGQAHFLDVRG